MNQDESVMARVTRFLVDHGIVAGFSGSLGGALTFGPNGFLLGPFLAGLQMLVNRYGGVVNSTFLSLISNPIVQQAINLIARLLMRYTPDIIDFCKRLIERLTSLWERHNANRYMIGNVAH